MRALVAVALVAVATRAYADARTQQLATQYDKEAGSCRIHEGGLAKVLAGATAMLADAHDDALVADVQALHDAHASVQAYCDELAAALDLLHADPTASFKSIEKQVDEHDNRIRKLRKDSQKALDATAPVVARLIPKINARSIAKDEAAVPKPPPKAEPPPPPPPPKAEPPPPPKAEPIIVLPKLAGKWRQKGGDFAEYTEGKAVTTITVRDFSDATCDGQYAAPGKAPGTTLFGRLDTGEAVWWIYTRDKRYIAIACRAPGVATIDAPELSPVMIHVGESMLAQHKPAAAR